MSASKPRYSPEEFSGRGTEIYERDIRPALRAEDEDQFVAIDIESGSYEFDRDDYAASKRLLARHASYSQHCGSQAARISSKPSISAARGIPC